MDALELFDLLHLGSSFGMTPRILMAVRHRAEGARFCRSAAQQGTAKHLISHSSFSLLGPGFDAARSLTFVNGEKPGGKTTRLG